MQSYVFDFDKSPTLFKKWNKEFDVEDLTSTCFYIAIVDEECDDNLNNCLDSEGHLIYAETSHTKTVECALTYTDTNDYGDAIVSLSEEVSFEFEENEMFALKGCFLLSDSGYVLCGSTNTFSVNVTNEIIFEKGLNFFTIVEGVFNG